MIVSLNRALEMLTQTNIQTQNVECAKRNTNANKESAFGRITYHNSQLIDHIYHRRCMLAFVHEADFKMKINENAAVI